MAVADDVVVYVEVPSGSRNTWELDEEIRGRCHGIAFSEERPAGTATRSTPSFPSASRRFPTCRIETRVAGVFQMTDERGPDEKIIRVPLEDPAWMRVSDVHDIAGELRNEVERFFHVYEGLEEAKIETNGYGNRADAERALTGVCGRAGPPPSSS